ncbi:MAG: ATP-binding protein [Pyrinomonadaceae bacterium]|nr:ATP-binding protein [Pyrinomonadaceae bacterium]MCX7639918.1 ATP-binding protein [Pyrinomonadaceae bacterium]MDW8304090.1 ATP-binding protein [Acidobacteriota bacterium]
MAQETSNLRLYSSFDSGKSENEETCSICFGTGIEIVAGKGARRCVCRLKEIQEKIFEKVRIPKRYANCSFSNYRPITKSQDIAMKYAYSLAQKYPDVEMGLLFMGSVGTGKTHLAVSILKGLTEKGFSCLFYEFGSLLKEIQDSYNSATQTSELRVLAPVFETEILVLDELGASKPTEWVRDIMSYIINTRYNDKKLTIFTTNYLDERKDDAEETLEDRIGKRLRSRLYEMCHTVRIEGPDYRRNFDKFSKIR